MPKDLIRGSGLETTPSLLSSPLLLTGSASLFYYVEIAFASKPGDVSYVWTDVTAYVKNIDYSRGRQFELNTVNAGQSTITLLNLDRRFEPGYAGSPYYPNVVPLKPIRVRLVLSGTSYTVFQGFVERWPEKRTGATYAEQDLTAVDGFELLSSNNLPGAAYPQELTGARINRVLDAAGWPAALRNISAGQSQVQSFAFADTDNLIALNHIQTVEAAEAGMFFIAGDGNATFLDRNTLNAAPYSVSQVTLSDRTADVTAGTAGLAYTASTPSFEKDNIYNDFQVTPTTNAAYPSLVLQEALDSTSEGEYLVRTRTMTVPLTSNADLLALAQYLVNSYKQPLLRHEAIEVRPGTSLTAWTQVLARELGDRVTVIEHPPGGGAAYDAEERIQLLHVSIPEHAADTTCQWGTYPAQLGSSLTLDDATLGKLDSGNSLFY